MPDTLNDRLDASAVPCEDTGHDSSAARPKSQQSGPALIYYSATGTVLQYSAHQNRSRVHRHSSTELLYKASRSQRRSPCVLLSFVATTPVRSAGLAGRLYNAGLACPRRECRLDGMASVHATALYLQQRVDREDFGLMEEWRQHSTAQHSSAQLSTACEQELSMAKIGRAMQGSDVAS